MPLKIVRNDITKMNTDAIVNTANAYPNVGEGCDSAVYEAAGWDELLSYRKEKIGNVPEGEVFLTPGFGLRAEYIIHAVSPRYTDTKKAEKRSVTEEREVEEKLRSCYRKSLALAEENHLHSIAFPLISTGSFGYPKEEGMRIAVDEINAFLFKHEMLVYLVVFDEKANDLGKKLFPDLEAYIDEKYVERQQKKEYFAAFSQAVEKIAGRFSGYGGAEKRQGGLAPGKPRLMNAGRRPERDAADRTCTNNTETAEPRPMPAPVRREFSEPVEEACFEECRVNTLEEEQQDICFDVAIDSLEEKLAERMSHRADTFSQYLLYLIASKHMENAEVYKRAIVDKKTFSKIKNNPEYHPQKITAMCLCVGAMLSLDETKDLLARAGYALSPCDKTDIIFSYFIENKLYDMIELDIQLEEHGLPCLIS